MSIVNERSVVTTTSTPRQRLSAADVDEMRVLLETHFDGVSAAQFAKDLEEKDWVLRVFLAGRLAGFSTLAVAKATVGGRVINVIYSGDTIMAPEAWGSPSLARGWIRLVRHVCAELPPRPCYWLLLSSGFRTYRFLPVFWAKFWPRTGEDTPVETQAMLDALANDRFGRAYDAKAGVVRFSAPQRLRAGLAEVPEGRRLDAHVAFFLAKNPGHADGDELVCLTELADHNLTPAGRRVVKEAGA